MLVAKMKIINYLYLSKICVECKKFEFWIGETCVRERNLAGKMNFSCYHYKFSSYIYYRPYKICG